jgi:hypothetical protein
MVETLIEAGLRWGELVALKPATSTSCAAPWPSPTQRTTNPGVFGVRQTWLEAIAEHIRAGIRHDDLLFPAVKASGIDFPVRVHDPRHAHDSSFLAGGADLASVMERTGHPRYRSPQKHIQTLPDTSRPPERWHRTAQQPHAGSESDPAVRVRICQVEREIELSIQQGPRASSSTRSTCATKLDKKNAAHDETDANDHHAGEGFLKQDPGSQCDQSNACC